MTSEDLRAVDIEAGIGTSLCLVGNGVSFAADPGASTKIESAGTLRFSGRDRMPCKTRHSWGGRHLCLDRAEGCTLHARTKEP